MRTFKGILPFSTVQVLLETGWTFLFQLTLDELIDAEARCFLYIKDTARLEVTQRSNWPKPLFDLMKLLRAVESTNKKIEEIEYEKFKGSIWTWGSTASNTVQEVLEKTKEKTKQVVDFINTKEAASSLYDEIQEVVSKRSSSSRG